MTTAIEKRKGIMSFAPQAAASPANPESMLTSGCPVRPKWPSLRGLTSPHLLADLAGLAEHSRRPDSCRLPNMSTLVQLMCNTCSAKYAKSRIRSQSDTDTPGPHPIERSSSQTRFLSSIDRTPRLSTTSLTRNEWLSATATRARAKIAQPSWSGGAAGKIQNFDDMRQTGLPISRCHRLGLTRITTNLPRGRISHLFSPVAHLFFSPFSGESLGSLWTSSGGPAKCLGPAHLAGERRCV